MLELVTFHPEQIHPGRERDATVVVAVPPDPVKPRFQLAVHQGLHQLSSNVVDLEPDSDLLSSRFMDLEWYNGDRINGFG